MERVRQTIHLGQQVFMIEVRATVQDHDRTPRIANKQPLGAAPHETLIGTGPPVCGSIPKVLQRSHHRDAPCW